MSQNFPLIMKICVSIRLLVLSGTLMVPALSHGRAAVEAWVQRYGGLTNSTDIAHGLAVDGSNNIVVVGYTDNGFGSRDMLVIKYSIAGLPLWTNRYNGPGNGNDEAQAVAVDAAGNVFVIGQSMGAGTLFDYVTIKYSADGTPLWTNRYNGPGNNQDFGTSIAFSEGKVFVTGYSMGTDSSFDYATIAYSEAGAPLWTNRYNGPGDSWDYAYKLTAGSNKMFVTGSSVGAGTLDDYATIAYSASGAALWTNRYNGPANKWDYAYSLALDHSGNVFVTGASGEESGFSYLTIGYSSTGTPLWTNRYHGPASEGDNFARGIAVDSSGNVLITGYSAGAGTGLDYATVSYSGAGVPLWTNRYNGTANNVDQASAIVVDKNDTIVVTGKSVGTGQGYGYVTIAYSPQGIGLWTNRYDKFGSQTDDATAIAANNHGNVIVTGNSHSGTNNDIATVAYGPPLTIECYDGAIGFSDGEFGFNITGTAGKVVVVESTSTFSHGWTPIWTNTLGPVPIRFSDSRVLTNAPMFYRAFQR